MDHAGDPPHGRAVLRTPMYRPNRSRRIRRAPVKELTKRAGIHADSGRRLTHLRTH